jgi:hypothetical protein
VCLVNSLCKSQVERFQAENKSLWGGVQVLHHLQGTTQPGTDRNHPLQEWRAGVLRANPLTTPAPSFFSTLSKASEEVALSSLEMNQTLPPLWHPGPTVRQDLKGGQASERGEQGGRDKDWPSDFRDLTAPANSC